MCKLIGLNTLWGNPVFIYEIPLADGSSVYMRADRSNYSNEDRAVVIVDAAKFLRLWRADPSANHVDVSSKDPTTWPADRKYLDAVQGFASGVENPVPLAEIGCGIVDVHSEIREPFMFFFGRKVGVKTDHVPYVSFTNGITRTIWLMTNGAKTFPVEVSAKEAELLYRHCGVGAPPRTVAELIPATWQAA